MSRRQAGETGESVFAAARGTYRRLPQLLVLLALVLTAALCAVAPAEAASPWKAQASGTEEGLTSVTFVNASLGWAVGDNGTILHTTDGGGTWTPQDSGTTTGQPVSVCFADKDTGWIALSFSTGSVGFLRTIDGGEHWTSQTKGTNNRWLDDMDFVGASNGWAVGWDWSGGGAVIYNTVDGGASWSPQVAGTQEALRGVDFVSASVGWVVGDYVIRKTEDGGETWHPAHMGLSTNKIRFLPLPGGGTRALAIGHDLFALDLPATDLPPTPR